MRHRARNYLPAGDAAARQGFWRTAADYHLAHALALGLTAYLVRRGAGSVAAWAGYLFAGGVVLFSGSLYVMALTGTRALGVVTPLGGMLLVGGWAAVALAGFKVSSR